MGEHIEELYPGHAEELRRHSERIARLDSAAVNPLPGPLLDAYAAVPFEVAGIRIRPVVHYDFVLLAKIESPLLQHMKGGDGTRTRFTDEQGYEMIWQFCRPAKQVAAEIAAYETQIIRDTPAMDAADVARAVREKYRARAIHEIGMSISIGDCILLAKAVEREFIRSFSTVVNYQSKQSEEGETFTQPPARATTGSAGGSTT